MSDDDYRGQHTAPGPDGGAPLHDLAAVYPDDVYGPNGFRYYGDMGTPYDAENFAHISKFRGKPEAPVIIYRAVPNEPSVQKELAKLEKDMAAYLKTGRLPSDAWTADGGRWYNISSKERDMLRERAAKESAQTAKQLQINAGDWVTTSRKYAKDHGESALNGHYKILSKKVKAKEIFTNGDSHHEWGYHPNGDIHKANGGSTGRRLTKQGLFSKAAEKALALQPGSFPAPQLIAQLINKGGISKDELLNAGIIGEDGKISPNWANRGKITREDLAEHFHNSIPHMEETFHGVTIPGQEYPEHLTEIETRIIENYRQKLDNLHQRVIDTSLTRQERDHAFEEYQKLQDQRDQEIERAIPNRAEEIAKTVDQYNHPKFDEWTLPEGENYRELLIHTPGSMPKGWTINKQDIRNAPSWVREFEVRNENGELVGSGDSQQEAMRDARSRSGLSTKDFQSKHWDTPNVLAHIRMSDRVGPNGEKVLHVEEIQSDWAQEGRRVRKDRVKQIAKVQGIPLAEAEKMVPADYGFGEGKPYKREELSHIDPSLITDPYRRNNFWHIMLPLGSIRVPKTLASTPEEAMDYVIANHRGPTDKIPSGPYVTNTQAWTDLALKRVLKEAAQGGYDKVVFTPGQQHADRYKLRNYVDALSYSPEDKFLQYRRKGRKDWTFHPNKVEPEELPKIIGDEAATRLMEQPKTAGGNHMLDTPDLEFGGEGMKAYYDKIIPNRLQKLVQKHDPQARVTPSDVMLPPERRFGSNNPPIQPLGIEMTPQMRQSILNGQEAFRDGGVVDDDDEEGFTAYHGSPHDFDQFDVSKIGTGEGNQAFGHGLYFAESETVAKEYRNRLSFMRKPYQDVFDKKWYVHDDTGEDTHGPFKSENEAQSFVKSRNGHMYEVHIKAHPEKHFLDWDKPVREQPHVLKAIDDHIGDPDIVLQRLAANLGTENPTGADLHDALGGKHKPQAVAEKLASMGLRGIRYLDAGSRNTGPAFDTEYLERQIAKNRAESASASGDHLRDLDDDHRVLLQRLADAKAGKHLSRNYVVFNHDHVRVKRKYAHGGAVI